MPSSPKFLLCLSTIVFVVINANVLVVIVFVVVVFVVVASVVVDANLRSETDAD